MHFSSDSQHPKHCRQENLSEQFHFSLWLSYALLMLIKYAVVNVLRHLVSRIQEYVNEWIVNISDITDYVKELNEKKSIGEDISLLLPKEQIYTV